LSSNRGIRDLLNTEEYHKVEYFAIILGSGEENKMENYIIIHFLKTNI
jgi:hypothetical protein